MEMDERTCVFMRDVVGVRSTQTSEPHIALGSAALFDVIALWHVLELRDLNGATFTRVLHRA